MSTDVISFRALRAMGGEGRLGYILRVVGSHWNLLNRRMAWSDLHFKEMTEANS